MPTYKEIQERYNNDTVKTSSAIRNLALSGIAALWVVANSQTDKKELLGNHSGVFKIAAICFVLALTLDLFHSFSESVLLWKYMGKLRKDFVGDSTTLFSKDHDLPQKVKDIPWIFYISKGSVLLVGGCVFLWALILL